MHHFTHITRRLPFLALLVLTPLLPGTLVADDKPLTLEAIFDSDAFDHRLPADTHWLPENSGLSYIDRSTGAVLRQDAGGAGTEVLIEADTLRVGENPVVPSAIRWRGDLSLALVTGPQETTWHGYRQGSRYIYRASDKSLWPLAEGNPAVRHAKLSPDGRHVGYVLDNNLYLVRLRDRQVIRVTRDGSEDIFNGIFDYGSSEFGGTEAWHWSPDGARIAFWRLDASGVREYPLIDELGNYSEVRRFPYPNAGTPHAENRIGVYALATGETQWLDTGHDPDDYLPRLDWDDQGSSLYVQHLTRDHQQLRLLRFSPGRPEPTTVLTETDPAWIDITRDFTALPGAAAGDFLWTSERSGFRHIYRYHDGDLEALTQGNWSVDAIIGVDPDRNQVYFYAKKDSLIDQHVYRIDLQGDNLTRVTGQPGWHEWLLSPDGGHALTTWSDARTPQRMALRDLVSGTSRSLAGEMPPGMRDYAMTHTEFIQFDTDDGITLNGYLIKPPGFDPDRQYPVIAYAYGNAGSQIVVNRWGTQRGSTQDLWHRYMAQQGYVVFAMDNRTTTGRGKAAKNLTYGHYAKYAVLDQLQGVGYLESLPWVDPERIGFWGWSGGGYLAAALMTKGAPHFKVAVSVAPVIDLTRYQAVGVERWMGSPEDNPEGYAAVNLMNYADQLQGKLLLMHGTGDENVKFAFTLQFVNALIEANKQFDMVVYPNQRHAIADARLHVFSTMTRYFTEHL